MGLYVAAALSPEHRALTVRELARLGFPTDVPSVRRTLIVCPPHLLKSWTDQVAAVIPGARVKVLRTLGDLDAEADVYLLSREAAKLGHRYRGLSGACPACGAAIETPASRNASRRLRCRALRRESENVYAELASMLAPVLAGALPTEPLVEAYVSGAVLRRRLERPAGGFDVDGLRPVYRRALAEVEPVLSGGSGLLWRLLADVATLAEVLGLEEETARVLGSLAAAASYHQENACRETIERLRTGGGPVADPARALLGVLESFHGEAVFSEGVPCGEPLFQAEPRPRRFPLARRIQKRYREKFDLILLDEAHEYNNTASAQTHAVHRLVGMPGVPTVVLTGSLMGGYASSLFANFWALSRRFREEFARSEKRAFVDRYGYRKVLVAVKDSGPAGYGKASDREIAYSDESGQSIRLNPVRCRSEATPRCPQFVGDRIGGVTSPPVLVLFESTGRS